MRKEFGLCRTQTLVPRAAVVSLLGARDVNEDSAAVVTMENGLGVLVADGLGGHGGGDVASRLAARAFQRVLAGHAGQTPELLLTRAFEEAQRDILEEQKRKSNYFQMKTTMCALVIGNGMLQWGHIGDTRLYAFSGRKLKTRTLDHSVPQMLVKSGELKEENIRNHPDRNKLLRVLGILGDTPRYELSKCFRIHKFQKYRRFLLCSDGFWELVLEKEMEQTMRESVDAEMWLEKMKKIALERGKACDMDNCTAIAVWM